MSIYAVNGKTPIAAWIPSRDDVGNGTTTLTDLVGSNNGTLTNMDPATDWVADTGAGGVRALDFDGVNDSVITGNLATSTANATITAWVKPNGAIGGNAGFITSRSDGLIGLVESFGAIDAVTASWNNTSAEWGNPGLSLNDNQWHFIALIVSGSTLTVYRDATFFTISITATSRTLGVFNLANDPGAGSRFFRGRIDDARIWSVALNATDVAAMWRAGRGATNIKSIDLSVNGKAPIAAWVPSLDTPTSGLSGNGTTTLTDLVGSNNGTLTNMDPATDWVADTDAGGVRALDFDGVNDQVVASASFLSLASGSVSLWANASFWGGFAGLFSMRTGSPTQRVELFRNSSNLEFRFFPFIASAITALPPTGSWFNLVVTWDNLVGLRLYLNGVLAASRNGTWVAGTPSGNFVLAALDDAGNPFNGRQDDIRIWNVALDATDVADLYAAGLGRGITFGGTIQTRRRRQLGGYGL